MRRTLSTSRRIRRRLNVCSVFNARTISSKTSFGQFRLPKVVACDTLGTVMGGRINCVPVVISNIFKSFGLDAATPQLCSSATGATKLEHIMAVGRLPEVHHQVRLMFNRPFTNGDADILHKKYVEAQLQYLEDHPDIFHFCPGFHSFYEWVDKNNIKFALTTGFPKPVADKFVERMVKAGYPVHYSTNSTDQPTVTDMVNAIKDRYQIPGCHMAYIGDTKENVNAGRNNEAITIFSSGCSAMLGIHSGQQANQVGPAELNRRIIKIEEDVKFSKQSPTFTVRTLDQIPMFFAENTSETRNIANPSTSKHAVSGTTRMTENSLLQYWYVFVLTFVFGFCI